MQRFVLHHGGGANGKSVFLETITRLLGSLAVGLPVELVTGNVQKSGSQAAPDIARLFGKRMVTHPGAAAVEPAGRSMWSKKPTGGEAIPVRTLFKGFFEFQPVCKPHFSTNGQPTVDDAYERHLAPYVAG